MIASVLNLQIIEEVFVFLHAQKHEQLSNIQFQECLFCTLSLANSDSVLVGVAYCSLNSSNANDSTLWKLINDAAEVASGSSHLLITGDFNLPMWTGFPGQRLVGILQLVHFWKPWMMHFYFNMYQHPLGGVKDRHPQHT